MRTACKKDHFKPSFSRQKRPPGVAQRSGAKSGAKRLDFSSNQHASASNQARPNVFTLKALSVSASTQPLNPRNIHGIEQTRPKKRRLNSGTIRVQDQAIWRHGLVLSCYFSTAYMPFSEPTFRQAHNLKVAGSNPAPATNLPVATYVVATGFFVLVHLSHNPMHPQCTPRTCTENGYKTGTDSSRARAAATSRKLFSAATDRHRLSVLGG